VCHKKLESEAQAVVPILALIMETKFGPRIWRWFFHSAKDVIVGYTWTEEKGIVSEEDTVLQDTWESGTLGLFEEDLLDDEAGSSKQKGHTKPKAKSTMHTSAKVKFDMVPRGPLNTGNTEDDLASRQSFTSALAPRQQKKRKNESASSATSSLTGNNTVDIESITTRFAEDPGFRDMLQALLQEDSSKNSRGGKK